MATGLFRLRLSPDQFWRLTPRELAVLLGATARAASGAPDRSVLNTLMQRFPDEANA